MKKSYIAIILVVLAFFIFLAEGPFYVVDEGSQTVTTRMGRIVNTHTQAGLYMKAPFIDKITTYPARILSLEGDSERIPTKENQFIIVDTTSRWRISDPALFYQSFKTLEGAYIKLSDVIDSATRTIITRNRLSEIVRSSNIINEKTAAQDSSLSGIADDESAEIEALLNVSNQNENVSKGRTRLCDEMTEEARKMMGEFGIELIDIVPRQIKYSDELTESVYISIVKLDIVILDKTARAALEAKEHILFGRCLYGVIKAADNIVSAGSLSAGKDNTDDLLLGSGGIGALDKCDLVLPVCIREKRLDLLLIRYALRGVADFNGDLGNAAAQHAGKFRLILISCFLKR